MGPRRFACFAVLALSALACARAPDPAGATCVHVLKRRLPDAEVVDVTSARGGRAAVRFELGEKRVPGHLACTVEATGSGGSWRVREATLDGVALTDAELAVVNADLFLHALARAGTD